jgi:hypothetical protein
MPPCSHTGISPWSGGSRVTVTMYYTWERQNTAQRIDSLGKERQTLFHTFLHRLCPLLCQHASVPCTPVMNVKHTSKGLVDCCARPSGLSREMGGVVATRSYTESPSVCHHALKHLLISHSFHIVQAGSLLPSVLHCCLSSLHAGPGPPRRPPDCAMSRIPSLCFEATNRA